MTLKAPFPFFGGKSAVAKHVWQALGDVNRYIEPFFGSGAVLLQRPNWKPVMKEIVNDKDCFIANVWRSLQFSPDETARWCDWPVNHIDLSARKIELIKNENKLREGLLSSPEWHDPVMAGYWIWAASCWIGSGLTRLGQIPHLTDDQGVTRLGKRPHLTHDQGVTDPYNTNIYQWFRDLSERLRYVKVTCGNWDIVCGGNWQANEGVCGIFFDPPYSSADRDSQLYQEESLTVAKEVALWAEERGLSQDYRIVLSGYYEEHEWLLGKEWTCLRWSANGGYSNQRKNKNRHQEALFLSPHCHRITMF